MGRYKSYLLTGGKVPRSTLWYQRKRRAEIEAKVLEESKKRKADQNITQQVFGDQSSAATERQDLAECQTTAIREESQFPPEANDICVSVASTSCLSSGEQRNSHEELSQEDDSVPVSDSDSVDEVQNLSDNDERRKIKDVNAVEQNLSSSLADNVESMHDICFNVGSNVPPDTGTEFSESQDRLKKKYTCLCPCTQCTAGDIILMTLALGFKHNLSWEAQVDVLRMVRAIYDNSDIPSSKYSYLKELDTDRANIEFHVYCPTCELYLGVKEEKISVTKCTNCSGDIEVTKDANFFLSVSIESQLKKKLQNEHFASLITSHKFSRIKENEHSFEDIYDGAEYKRLFDNGGILSSPFNFSYCFFLDGIPLGKSSNKTIWPIYLTLNELPFEERSKNVILAGLYIGPKDPNQEVFLKPFVDAANKLSTKGFTWIYKTKTVVSKVIPLCSIVDSVARYQLLNFQSFHAYYGCTFCYQKSVRTRKRQKFVIPPEPAKQRTDESTKADLLEAYKRKDAVKESERHFKGVKGPTPLMSLFYFNIISGFVVDYMHAILLGVIRTHMELLLESTHKKFWIGMDENDRIGVKHLRAAIDKRLLSMKTPSTITRVPRTIVDMKLWKASEWRSWLLFYCVPCLSGLLKEKHICHLALLSKATNLLLQKSVSLNDVNEAHRLFMSYTFFFQKYFGDAEMVYNVHLLSHIAKGVLNWGPLWGHNCFSFEGLNRHLLQLCCNASNVVFSITRKFLIYHSFPLLVERLASSTTSEQFCEHVLDRRLKRFVRSDGCILLGSSTLFCNLPKSEKLLLSKLYSNAENCVLFRKLIFKRKRFTTVSYIHTKKNNDSCLCTTSGKYAVIQFILSDLSDKKVVLVAQECKIEKDLLISNQFLKFNQIRKVETLSSLFSIQPHEIKCQCLFMEVGHQILVCNVPFGCDGD